MYSKKIKEGTVFTYLAVAINLLSFLLVQPYLYNGLGDLYVEFIFISFLQGFTSIIEFPLATILTTDRINHKIDKVFTSFCIVFLIPFLLTILGLHLFSNRESYMILMIAVFVTLKSFSNVLRGYNNGNKKFKSNFLASVLGAVFRNFIPLLILNLTNSIKLFWISYFLSSCIEFLVYMVTTKLKLRKINRENWHILITLRNRILSLGVFSILGLILTQMERTIILKTLAEEYRPLTTLFYQYLSAFIALLMPMGQLFLSFTKEIEDDQLLSHSKKIFSGQIIIIVLGVIFAFVPKSSMYKLILLLTPLIISNVALYYFTSKIKILNYRFIPYTLAIILLTSILLNKNISLLSFIGSLIGSNLLANLGYWSIIVKRKKMRVI